MRFVPRVQVLTFLYVLMLAGMAIAEEQKPAPQTDPQDKPIATQEAAKAGDTQTKAGGATANTAERPEADVLSDKENKPLGPPTTKTIAGPKEIVPADALLAPPPAPKGKVSLIGGTVKNIDQIRNRMEVNIFGGKKMKMFFDERSHFFRDGVESTQLAVKKGDRVYVDSQLDQGKIFARNVRVQSEKPVGAASGQVLSYNPRNGELTLAEPISARPLMFRVTRDTAFRRGDQPGSAADLRNNAIVRVTFLPMPGKRSEVKEVELVAVPGTRFAFYGRLTHLDLRSGLLGVENKSDSRLYEVRFRPSPQTVTDDLVIGAEVSIVAVFTGKDYAAETLQVTRTAQGQSKDEVQ